ncbi:alpha/beta fold hydrolase [Streptomyces sp. NPDC052396]|uniref:alpha/beta fold hydrolase n=1 Tax=Streptomyces sp. NPDC052396 TaxID=3365689 RepID=UPI0037D8B363
MDDMVRVRDGEVWADDTGGAGLPLVLLHPGVGSSTIWDRVVPRLSEHHRVIRYDARGYGRSPAPTSRYSQIEDLAAVLDHFRLDRAVLLGSSLGGATALGLALRHPARVAGLALFCPGVTGYDGLATPEFLAELTALAEAGDHEGIVALCLRIWAAAGPDEEIAATLRAVVPAWFTTYPHQEQDEPAFGRLGELAVPCLLALGELDQPEVVRCNEEMAARIPGCRLVRMKDWDHFPSLRDPETVVALTLELCAELPS